MVKIILEDGTVLGKLELNGNNFISDSLINDNVFEGNLSKVTIIKENAETKHENMKLIQNKQHGNQSWFILAEKTKEELEKEEINQLLADLTELVLIGGGI